MSDHSAVSARRGFTIMELLVVLGIAGLLIALLVPAVMASRNASQRLSCSQRLRQLSLALQNYAETHRSLPPWLVASGGDRPCDYDSALTLLWPFLELPSKCEAIAQGLDRVPVMMCPSDGDLDLTRGPLSYVVNASPGIHSGSRAKGPFFVGSDRGVTLNEVTDGLSSTAAISEALSLRSEGTESQALAEPARYLTWRVVVPALPPGLIPGSPQELAAQRDQTEASLEDCYGRARVWDAYPAGTGSPRDWIFSNKPRNTYTHWLIPNAPFCRAGHVTEGIFLEGAFSAGSAHRGGVNVAFLDGHVKFMADGVATNVWRAQGTIDGGEPEGGSQP
jgi:prepilin-type processing-associated H-X9-DG protein/prepilin-type N-terminal cleavage/methylation domain-containing protein